MMQKHAYMIVAHNQFFLLQKLCQLLDDPRNDLFIHIDAKVNDFDPKMLTSAVKYSEITFVDRISISWGGMSMVRCELLLLKAAMDHSEYSYFHLISGVDLPLKNVDTICNFFEMNSGKEFIHFCTNQFCESDAVVDRARLYYFLQEKAGRGPNLLSYIQKIDLIAQKVLGVDRRKKLGKTVACGSQWFSITQALAKYILEQESWIISHFNNTLIPDEMFLQTLVGGTPFEDHLYLTDEKGDYRSCLRYVDWRRGNPYVFRSVDFDDLIRSPYLFARKFDLNVDAQIVEKIYNHLKGSSE